MRPTPAGSTAPAQGDAVSLHCSRELCACVLLHLQLMLGLPKAGVARDRAEHRKGRPQGTGEVALGDTTGWPLGTHGRG